MPIKAIEAFTKFTVSKLSNILWVKYNLLFLEVEGA